jgi:hypothetical protein
MTFLLQIVFVEPNRKRKIVLRSSFPSTCKKTEMNDAINAQSLHKINTSRTKLPNDGCMNLLLTFMPVIPDPLSRPTVEDMNDKEKTKTGIDKNDKRVFHGEIADSRQNFITEFTFDKIASNEQQIKNFLFKPSQVIIIVIFFCHTIAAGLNCDSKT